MYQITNYQNSVVCIGSLRFNPHETKTLADDVLARSAGPQGMTQLSLLNASGKMRSVYVKDATTPTVAIAPGVSTPFGQRLMMSGSDAEARQILGVGAGSGEGSGEGTGLTIDGYHLTQGLDKLTHTRTRVGGEDGDADSAYHIEGGTGSGGNSGNNNWGVTPQWVFGNTAENSYELSATVLRFGFTSLTPPDVGGVLATQEWVTVRVPALPETGTYSLKCVDGVATLVED